MILNVTKSANGSELKVGDKVKFTITVNNVGSITASDVNITDDLVPEFEFIWASDDGVYHNNGTVTWNIANLNPNSPVTVEVIVKVQNFGKFNNTAIVTSKENKTETNGTTNITVIPYVDLDISKVSNVTFAKVGDNINFTIKITNNGLSNATNVVVSDILDSEFTYVSGGSYNASTRNVTWTINNIEAGRSVEVYVVVSALTNGTFANTVSAYADENTTKVNGTSNNVTVIPYIVWSIIKEADVSTLYVGDLVNFTITIFNNGPSNATQVGISDILNSDFEFVNASENYTIYHLFNSIQWDFSEIPVGSGASVWVQVRVLNNGTYINWAHVSSSESQIATSNKTNINVKPVVNLDVVKSANVSDVFIGDKVKFVIAVTDNGPSNTSNVIVVDTLPNGLKFISSNVSCVVRDNVVIWNVSKLTAGETINIEVICEAVSAGDLINTVNVTCDENKTSITNGTPIHVSELVDVAIILSANNTKPDINATIVINLTLRNDGLLTATQITGRLNKDFLSGLEIISIDSKDIIFNSGDLLSYSLSDILRFNEDGTFELAILEPFKEASATITARVIRDGNLTIDGSAFAIEKDSNLTNNYNNLTLNVHSLVDLSVNVTANDSTPTVGDEIEYTIVVVNKGPSNATGVIADDKLPDGVTYVSDNGGGAYNPNTGVWTVDDIKPGENRTLIIKVKVDVPGEITNFVDVNSSQDNTNPDGAKNNVTINVKNPDKVDLRLTKTVNNTKPYVGDFIVYTITVSNKGNNTATGVLVYEDLLEGLEYISDDSHGEYNPVSGIWDIGHITPGETKVLNILVQVSKAGNITNYAIVDADQEILNITASYDSVTIEAVEHDKNETDNDTSIPQNDGNIRLKEAGNPLMILIVALLSAGLYLRRKKQ